MDGEFYEPYIDKTVFSRVSLLHPRQFTSVNCSIVNSLLISTVHLQISIHTQTLTYEDKKDVSAIPVGLKM